MVKKEATIIFLLASAGRITDGGKKERQRRGNLRKKTRE